MTTSGQLGFLHGAPAEPLDLQVATPWFEEPFFAVDVEATGLQEAASDCIIELALVPFNMPHQKTFSSLFCVGEALSPEITNITGITNEMLKGQPSFCEMADCVIALFKQVPFVVAYNAKFDRPFIESELARVGPRASGDSVGRPLCFSLPSPYCYKRGKKLSDSERWGVHLENAHRAEDDARAVGR